MATPPTFVSGAILTAAQMNSIGLWRVTTCTVTSSGGTAATASNGVISVGAGNSSVSILNAFSADFDNYKIIWSGGTASALSLLNVYMGTAAATAYYGSKTSTSVLGVTNSSGDNNVGSWGFADAVGTTTATTGFDLYSPFATTRTNIDSAYWELNGASSTFGRYTGVLDNATSYTGITFDPQGATTMSGGKIFVYGYNIG